MTNTRQPNQTSKKILSESQKFAINWREGSFLMLAGPGVGKTTVLTMRLANILRESNGKNFRLLALTYTNKAANEMRQRIEVIAPNTNHRTFIGTFHSFCAKILRQHGSHIGIKPDFEIYENNDERSYLLKDALLQRSLQDEYDVQCCGDWIETLDRLRKNLVGPKQAKEKFSNADYGKKISELYTIYEQALLKENAMDFNGLILNTCRLLKKVPMISSSYRNVYRYWCIDEFQDTTKSQYRFIKILAGNVFNNIFVVADEDQIIFQFAGASFEQMKEFRDEFKPKVKQLIENRRCPDSIVSAASALIEKNSERIATKRPLVSTVSDGVRPIRCLIYSDELSEGQAISLEIRDQTDYTQQSMAVLARTKTVLNPILNELKSLGIKASIASRRNNFISPHFNWLFNCLKLANQPNSRLLYRNLTEYGNRIAGTKIDSDFSMAEPISTHISLLEYWSRLMDNSDSAIADQLSALAAELVYSQSSWKEITERSVEVLSRLSESTGIRSDDFFEDKEAWQSIYNSLRSTSQSDLELPEFLQGMNLHSKQPPADVGEIRLFTIHSAKGLEFDHVWLAGMADSILPSWQSLKGDADPQLLEEERRACFVGMTRAKKTLTLTYAKSYKGHKKPPSRFLREMGLI